MSGREILLAALVAVGLGCVTYGVLLLCVPAAWIVGGLAIVGLTFLCLLEV